MRSTIRRAAAAVIVLPAVLGACSQAETPDPATTSVSTGSTSVPSAPSTGSTDAPPAAGGTYSDKASFIAAMKQATGTTTTVHFSMEMDGAGQGIRAQGQQRLSADDPAMHMTMNLGAGELEMILVDNRVFIKGMPGQADTSTWTELDADGAIGQQMLEATKQADPSKTFDQFDAALTDVKHVGEEEVNGEPMQKYEATLDVSKSPDLKDNPAAGQLPEEIVYNVWLDGQDRMRQVTFDVAGITAKINLDKYGEPVDIAPPPADQVVPGPTA